MILDAYISGVFSTRQIAVGNLFNGLNGTNGVNGTNGISSVAGISTLTYTTNQSLSFSTNAYRILALTDNVNFTSANLTAGVALAVRVYASGGAREVYFPAGWIWLGSVAPTNLASGKYAILSATSFGTTDANVVAAWGAQP
jgi:hypothetical protein